MEPEDLDGFEDDDGCPDFDHDGDGIAEELDHCPDEPEDLDGVEDEDGCPENPEVALVTATHIELAQQIHFETDTARLSSRSFAVLDEVARILRSHPELSVVVEGHTDSRGGQAHNRSLSEARAAAVVTYLSRRLDGDRSRLTPVGLGFSQPVASNRTLQGRAQNRRVQFRIVPEPTR